jgi:LAS superfamily LD-carboxypeptidase LdcB
MRASAEQVLGLDERGLVSVPGCGDAVRRLHPIVLKDFIALRDLCADRGIHLAIASSYRSFDQQLTIWNQKMRGERPVYDAQANIIDIQHLSDFEKITHILRWSALPGCSRHHWGSDLDVYDLAAIPEGYQLQLVPQEYAVGGPFEKLGRLFDRWFSDEEGFAGFYRPYAVDDGRVSYEPWHISHSIVADAHLQVLSEGLVKQYLAKADIAGKDAILQNFEEIWRRFVA